MNYERSTHLTNDAKKIREAVFISEQGFKNEIDAIDKHAIHLIFYKAAQPVGVCRYFISNINGVYIIGRLAVLKKYRKDHIGAYILQTAEQNIIKDGGKKAVLSAQLQAQKFYEKYGYVANGPIYMDEHCPHIHMEKLLNNLNLDKEDSLEKF
ncbi:GNAT family N-acetyltransferase [Pectinatus frisingensis]|uniref:GNAT family N-acetyltransferase n=1 Tax=Pectinatus frisingensis TaxID=865 RepID=UPI0018C785C4|nr:GNAT family N-acetyltransferase [Pectinatus frisingensis]